MAIYTPDGTIIFNEEEVKHHHPWCNHYGMPRKGCKQCEHMYIKYPLREDMMSYFPIAEVIQ